MNVSSLAHKLFGQLDLANLNSEKSVVIRSLYAHTKLAIILFTRELSKRLGGSGTLMMFVTYKTCNIAKCVFVYVSAYFLHSDMPSVLSHCWFGIRRGIWPVKN